MKNVFKKILSTNEEDRYINNDGFAANMLKVVVIFLITAALSEGIYMFDAYSQAIPLLYLLAVLIISVSTPYAYGACAAVIGTLICNFQAVEERFELTLTRGFPVTLLIMLLVTIVVSTITSRIREKALVSIRRERRVQQLSEIGQKLLAARNLETIRTLTEEYLTNYLGRPTILYVKDPSDPAHGDCEPSNDVDKHTRPLYTPDQIRRVHHIFRIGESETGRPFDDSSYDVFNIPAISNGKLLGVVGIVCRGTPIRQNDLTFVQMLTGQVALALEIQRLSDEQAKSVVETEKEKTRGTLLRSISHDLRTPLTSILGASSAILEQKDLDSQTLKSLANDIKTDAQWLIRLVENILIVTRISGESLKVKKQPEAAEEVVSEAVSIVRKRFPGYTFNAHIPDEVILVPMDVTLISQVLINLLENAAKNSPNGSLILIALRKKGNYAEFDVIDSGSGIPENLLDDLFNVNSVNSVDTYRGTGLGLSICKTIVHAHGGTIEGRNRSKQGSEFTFRLPL